MSKYRIVEINDGESYTVEKKYLLSGWGVYIHIFPSGKWSICEGFLNLKDAEQFMAEIKPKKVVIKEYS